MVLASSHEAHHAALNAITSWGAMLQAVALAARFAVDAQYGVVLRYLVAVAARTHEAHATHASVMDVLRAGAQLARQSCLARTLRIVATWTQQCSSVLPQSSPTRGGRSLRSRRCRHACSRPHLMFFCRRASTGSRHPCFLAGLPRPPPVAAP